MTIETFSNFGRMLARQRAIEGMLAGKGLDRLLEQQRREDLARLWRTSDEERWLKLAQLDDRQWRDDRLGSLMMAATPATANFTQMAKVAGNSGGALQSLPGTNVTGGRQRTWIDTLVLNSQVAGTVFGVARLPLYATLLCIELITDTSLGSATIKFGDAGNGNSAIYAAAQTLTSTQTIVRTAATGTKGAPITTGFDSVTGNSVSPFMPQTPGEGGLVYEDIIMTTAAASLPASGNLIVMIEYVID